MTSVIVAAHDEEAVIGRCLDALARQDLHTDLEIIVSANGCTDATADIARAHGAVVIDRSEPGKAAAINAAEIVASSFPRIYLDADIVVPEGGLADILGRFGEASGPLAVVPARRVATEGRPWPVRAYFAINERLPAFRNGLFGRGLIAISEEGRARFDEFPTLIADDLFLDSQFSDAEKSEADRVVVTVEAPFTTVDLLRRLVRVRRGNSQMRMAAAAGEVGADVRTSDRWAWLRVVMRRPWLAPQGATYAILTVVAARRARSHDGQTWGRDESTRRQGARP